MLDLEAMAAHVDAVLSAETPESLRAWLDDYRKRQAALRKAERRAARQARRSGKPKADMSLGDIS